MYKISNYDEPTQEIMCAAQFNQNIFPYTMPFTYADEVFVQLSQYLPQYNDHFWVSNSGRVYNAHTGYLVTPKYRPNTGYITITISKKNELNKNDNIGVHVLVANCFIGPKPGPGYRVVHLDGNRCNNHYTNLVWRLERTPDTTIDVSMEQVGCSEEQLNTIYRMIRSGILNIVTISQVVFGRLPTPEISSFIYSIEYGNDNIQKANITRTFTEDHIIHAMCRYMKDNPQSAYSANLKTVLAYSGIDTDSLDPKVRYRYSGALNQLRYKNAYRSIADMYEIPMNGGN